MVCLEVSCHWINHDIMHSNLFALLSEVATASIHLHRDNHYLSIYAQQQQQHLESGTLLFMRAVVVASTVNQGSFI